MTSPRVNLDGVEVSPDHFINGRRVDSSHTFEDRSPLDWSWKLADVARGTTLKPTKPSARLWTPSRRGRR